MKLNKVTFFLYLLLLISIPLTSLFIKNIRQKNITFRSPVVIKDIVQPDTAIGQVAGEKIELAQTTIRLSVLNNQDLGYKFLYPQYLKVITAPTGIELSPKSGKGKLVVSARDKIINIQVINQDLTEDELNQLNLAAEIIKNNFSFYPDGIN